MPGFILLSLALVPGCAPQETVDPRVKVYPVEGKLLVWDRPAADASIGFHAVDKDRTRSQIPVGTTAADGTFRLMTYAHNDGAPEGEYTITIYWPHDPLVLSACECDGLTTHDRFFGRYSDPARSELRITIRPERNEFVLNASVGSSWNLPLLKDINTPQERPAPRDQPATRAAHRDRVAEDFQQIANSYKTYREETKTPTSEGFRTYLEKQPEMRRVCTYIREQQYALNVPTGTVGIIAFERDRDHENTRVVALADGSINKAMSEDEFEAICPDRFLERKRKP